MSIGGFQLSPELYVIKKALKCLELMASTHPITQKPLFEVFDKILQKLSCKTFHIKIC